MSWMVVDLTRGKPGGYFHALPKGKTNIKFPFEICSGNQPQHSQDHLIIASSLGNNHFLTLT